VGSVFGDEIPGIKYNTKKCVCSICGHFIMTNLLVLHPFAELANLIAGRVNLDAYTANYGEEFYVDYASNCPTGCWAGMDSNYGITGFCLTSLEDDRNKLYRGHVGCLSVAPHCRGTSVGRSLMSGCINAVKKTRGRLIDLWVRKNNVPAVKFYQKLGFMISGVNPGYYAEPVDDAYEMFLPLDNNLTLNEFIRKETERGVKNLVRTAVPVESLPKT